MHIQTLMQDWRVEKSSSFQASQNKNGVFLHASTSIMLIMLAAWLK